MCRRALSYCCVCLDLIQGVPVSSQLSGKYLQDFDLFILGRTCVGSAWSAHCLEYYSHMSLGSVPFILREKLSYSQLGVFALSSYPYSLKLLWSPIVDSMFFPSIGRRKSWIIPMQLILGSLMLYISINVQKLLDEVSCSVIILCALGSSILYFGCSRSSMYTN